jgi:hypothetical protein
VKNKQATPIYQHYLLGCALDVGGILPRKGKRRNKKNCD